MSQIIRSLEPPVRGFDLLPSQRDQGVVEELAWAIDADTHHVHLNRWLWTLNKRRAARDQRGEVIRHEVVLTLTPQEAAVLSNDLTWSLIHVDSRGPKVSGKKYDHDARPDDDPEDGDRCKDCGEDITWLGPSQSDWLHVDDEENQ
jgi:hypothetical protein